MLRTLDRYVLRELAGPFLWTGVVLTFVLIVDRIYELTDLVVTHGVPFSLVLGLAGFMLPALWVHILPMALLVAVLLVTGRLAADREVTALAATGVSPLRLFRAFVLAASLVALTVGLLTFWLAPRANHAFERRLVKIFQARATTGISERAFTSLGQVVIYVSQVSPSRAGLRGVLVSDERDPERPRIVTAREGRLLSDERSERVTLRLLGGTIHEADATAPYRYRSGTFALYDLSLSVDAQVAGMARVLRPEETLALRELLDARARLREQGQNPARHEVEVHKRFALPLTALAFCLVGFPLGIRARGGGRAVAVGASLGVAAAYYLLLSSLVGVALVGQMPPWAAVWTPTLLFGAAGATLLLSTATRLRARTRRRGEEARAVGPARRARARPLPGRARPRAFTWLIDRYLIREYLKYVAYGLAVGGVLFTVADTLQTMDSYLARRPAFSLIVEYALLQLPLGLHQMLPMVILVATIFLFISLARHHELTALKAAGVSLYRIGTPVLALALGVSLASAGFQETFLPRLSATADEVYRTKIRGEPPTSLQRRTHVWYRSSETRFFRISLLDPAARSMEGITLLELDGDFRIVERLDARHVHWTPRGWEFRDGVFREIGRDEGVEAVPFGVMTLELPERIEDFTRLQRPASMMTFLEFRAHLQRLQESGYQVRKDLVTLYEKLSFPLIHAVSALVAIPLALVAPQSGHLVGVGWAVVITMGYWLVHSMALSLAKADLLPPLLAAWTANILFTGLGLFFFLRART